MLLVWLRPAINSEYQRVVFLNINSSTISKSRVRYLRPYFGEKEYTYLFVTILSVFKQDGADDAYRNKSVAI